MKILLVKLSAIGDVVQSLPVLAALRTRYPEAYISWIVGEAAFPLLMEHPLLDEIILFPRQRLGKLASGPRSWPRLAFEAGCFMKRLRSKRYDVVIDLQGLLKSGILTWFSRAGRKIGFAGTREGSAVFLTERLPAYDPDEHAVLRYLRLAAYLGAETPRPLFPLGLDSRDRTRARNMLKDLSVDLGRFLIMIPGTAWPTKRWTASGFAQVADLAWQRWGIRSVIVGSSSDSRLARAILKKAGSTPVDLTGKTDLKTLAALYGFASVVVTTDTGPMHLAAATGAPVVALFGPTAPWRTGPYCTRKRVIRKELSCSPCFRRSCDKRDCMINIDAHEVLEAVEDIRRGPSP